jgi:hypothetical protein
MYDGGCGFTFFSASSAHWINVAALAVLEISPLAGLRMCLLLRRPCVGESYRRLREMGVATHTAAPPS